MGTEEAIFVMEQIIQDAIEHSKKCHIGLIDFSSAFDNVSHKYMKQRLWDSGASMATIQLVNCLYNAATGYIKIRNKDGSSTKSETFEIKRGNVQGDISSPKLFTGALRKLEEDEDPLKYDSSSYKIFDLRISSLYFADDGAQITQSKKELSKRMTNFGKKAEEKADLKVNMKKTFAMEIKKGSKLEKPKEEDFIQYSKNSKFKCETCNRGFPSSHSLSIHKNLCNKKYDGKLCKDKHHVFQIVGCRGNINKRVYMILWCQEFRKPVDTSNWTDEITKQNQTEFFEEETLPNGEYKIQKIIGGPVEKENNIGELEDYFLVHWASWRIDASTMLSRSSLEKEVPELLENYLSDHKDFLKRKQKRNGPYINRTISTSQRYMSWEPSFFVEDHCKEELADFWENNKEAKNRRIIKDSRENRCMHCGKNFKRPSSLKGHHKKKSCIHRPPSTTGSKTEKIIMKRNRAKKDMGDKTLTVGENEIKYIDEFEYLGHWITYNGDQRRNLEIKMAKAQANFGGLRRIWIDKKASLDFKLRIYKTLVIPILTYANAAWILDEETIRSLRNWNSKNLNFITGYGFAYEARHPSYDLILKLRQRRARWLKKSITTDPNLVLTKLLIRKAMNRKEGDIFMDMPNIAVEKLIKNMTDIDKWRNIYEHIT